MQQYKETMTLHEKLQIGVKAIELRKQGKIEEATRLRRSIPLSPYMAKWAKERMGPISLFKAVGTCPRRRPILDQTGLILEILETVELIAKGRKGLAVNGEEHEGRLHYEEGIAQALAAFQEAQTTRNSKTLVLAEEAFLRQEFEFCAETDTETRSSLSEAIRSYSDALRCLETVENTAGYRLVETAFSTSGTKYRYQGFPRDAVNIAADSHWARIKNVLRAPGINMIEKTVLQQRAANLKTLHAAHYEKQRKALEGVK
jgi:hypothetical protein